MGILRSTGGSDFGCFDWVGVGLVILSPLGCRLSIAGIIIRASSCLPWPGCITAVAQLL